MDYKEKLEDAKRLYETANADQKYVLESLFSELKESEGEKVRKALVEMVHDTTGDELWVDYNVHKEKALAWLEKQGEQKPIIEMKTPEESLGIDSNIYNEIVDKCIYGEQKSQRMISAEAKEAMYGKPSDKIEQKSSWTKEDDVRLQVCIDTLQAESLMGKVDTVMTKWLKSLKQRIEGRL